MQKLLSTNFSEEVLNLKPKLPEVTCEFYITDSREKMSFFEWIRFYENSFAEPEENEWLSDNDRLRYSYLLLPNEVRQAGHLRLFGNHWKHYATRKSLYLAGLAFFKPESGILTVVYKEAKLIKQREDRQKVRANQFLYQIAKGNFS
tara:strand:- start:22 stop:462 length:441 start_codon:yes stop_codon:yes gene_type:complete